MKIECSRQNVTKGTDRRRQIWLLELLTEPMHRMTFFRDFTPSCFTFSNSHNNKYQQQQHFLTRRTNHRPILHPLSKQGRYIRNTIHVSPELNSRTNKSLDSLSKHLTPPPSYRRARELSECSGDTFYPPNLKEIEIEIIEDEDEQSESEQCVGNTVPQFNQIDVVWNVA